MGENGGRLGGGATEAPGEALAKLGDGLCHKEHSYSCTAETRLS